MIVSEKFILRKDLMGAVTPKHLKLRPIYNWFYFPHSFSPELVFELLDHWKLRRGCRVLDLFVGAGTTLLAAKERGLSGLGTDLSPLAVAVSDAKLRDYNSNSLLIELDAVLERYNQSDYTPPEPSERVARALTQAEYRSLLRLREAIKQSPETVKGFFFLAFLQVLRECSRAVPDGGWFRWVEKPDRSEDILPLFRNIVSRMISDVSNAHLPKGKDLHVKIHDARSLHELGETFDAIITSPPYPNRHDYSRVFHLELLIASELAEDDIFDLRYRSLRSHVEARPPIEDASSLGYKAPEPLLECLSKLPFNGDKRIAEMVQGYFADMFLVLRAGRKVLKATGRVALVVGNVRHQGVMFPVDEILVAVAKQAGFSWEATWVARFRGNSAQQMGRFGKEPARESVILLHVN